MQQNFVQEPQAYSVPPRLKECFQRTYEILAQRNVKTVIDLGCASGEFHAFLPSPMTGLGVDVSQELIDIARRQVVRPGVSFEVGDFRDPDVRKRIVSQRFDAVTMMGFLHAFLDFEEPLSAALDLGARFVVVHSPFNPHPVDVQIFHRLTGTRERQCAYTISSKSSVEEFLTRRHVKSHSFIPFRMSGQLNRDPDASPLRNWHTTVDGEQKCLTNGTGIILHEYLLVIEL